jgi:hypothetical protein
MSVMTQSRRRWAAAAALGSLMMAACGAPDTQGLRESFVQQVRANQFVSDLKHGGDELTFTGPGPEGGQAKWRVVIDSAVVERQDNEKQPYKGTVKSSWYADGQAIRSTPARSGLPFELLSNGVSQDCWALWDPAANRWAWE